jgi:hypothetical protein
MPEWRRLLRRLIAAAPSTKDATRTNAIHTLICRIPSPQGHLRLLRSTATANSHQTTDEKSTAPALSRPSRSGRKRVKTGGGNGAGTQVPRRGRGNSTRLTPTPRRMGSTRTTTSISGLRREPVGVGLQACSNPYAPSKRATRESPVCPHRGRRHDRCPLQVLKVFAFRPIPR